MAPINLSVEVWGSLLCAMVQWHALRPFVANVLLKIAPARLKPGYIAPPTRTGRAQTDERFRHKARTGAACHTVDSIPIR